VVVAPADRLACNGNNINAIVFNGPTGADQYVWNNSDSSIGIPSTGSGNIPSFQAVNPGVNAVTAQISVLPILNGCFGAPQSFSVTVNPTPSMNPVNNQQVCSGTSTQAVDFTGTVAGTDFSWVNNNNAIGLPGVGTGSIPSFTPVNNGSDMMNATITITPTFNGCQGPAQSFVISVAPNPTFDQPANQSVCRGQISPAIPLQSTVNGITYQWSNNNPAIGLPAQGTGNIPSFITQASGNTRETAIITVSSNANGCVGTDKIFEISVEPIPEMSQPSNLTACSGSAVNPADFHSNVNNTTFTWTNSNAAIGLAASGSGNIPSFLANNTGNAPISGMISVVSSLNGCGSMPQLFEIVVNPLPVVDPIADKQTCAGKQTDMMVFSGNAAGSEYQWSNNNTSIGLASNGSGNIMPFQGINNTSQAITATITVFATNAQQCRSAAQQFSVVINPMPQLSVGNDVTVCKGSTSTLTASGAQNYQWSPSIGLSCSNCATPVATVTDSITYQVTGTNVYGCEKTEAVKVNVIPNIEMLVSPNDTLCAGFQVQLFARGAERYEWSPSAGLNNAFIASPVATPTVSTRYRVIGHSTGSCFSDTGYVFIQVAPVPGVNAGPDIEGQTGSTVNLAATAQGNVTSWSWSPSAGLSCNDCPNPVLTISGNTTYELTVKNRYGCTAKDSLRVITFCKSSQVFVPNAFTPDGDGVNDMLMVRGEGIFVKSFRIFNRWGNLVFEKLNFAPNDPTYGWNGKVKGIAAAPDVFVYIAEVTCDNGTVYFHKGNTTLLK
jgi:gliding motility-associated-like protein